MLPQYHVPASGRIASELLTFIEQENMTSINAGWGGGGESSSHKGGETAEIHGGPRNKPFLGAQIVAKRSMETPARCLFDQLETPRRMLWKTAPVENSTRCLGGNAEILLWKCRGRGKQAAARCSIATCGR